MFCASSKRVREAYCTASDVSKAMRPIGTEHGPRLDAVGDLSLRQPHLVASRREPHRSRDAPELWEDALHPGPQPNARFQARE